MKNLLLVGDLHLREDTPTCRMDDFWEMQWETVEFIRKTARKYDAYVLQAGDMFHHWKPSPFLLSETLLHIGGISTDWLCVAGQHDLQDNTMENFGKSGLQTLQLAGPTFVLGSVPWIHENMYVYGASWGEPVPMPNDPERFNVLVMHKLLWMEHAKPFSRAHSQDNVEIWGPKLQKMGYHLVLVGDNHEGFYWMKGGDSDFVLVNPGAATRQSAGQKKHHPCCYLWRNEGAWSFIPIKLPDQDPDAVTREHIEQEEERDQRIAAFVDRLDGKFDVGLSFRENMNRFFGENRIRKMTMRMIEAAMEEEE